MTRDLPKSVTKIEALALLFVKSFKYFCIEVYTIILFYFNEKVISSLVTNVLNEGVHAKMH